MALAVAISTCCLVVKMQHVQVSCCTSLKAIMVLAAWLPCGGWQEPKRSCTGAQAEGGRTNEAKTGERRRRAVAASLPSLRQRRLLSRGCRHERRSARSPGNPWDRGTLTRCSGYDARSSSADGSRQHLFCLHSPPYGAARTRMQRWRLLVDGTLALHFCLFAGAPTRALQCRVYGGVVLVPTTQ